MDTEVKQLLEQLERSLPEQRMNDDLKSFVRTLNELLTKLEKTGAQPNIDLEKIKNDLKNAKTIMQKCIEHFAVIQKSYEYHDKNLETAEAELTLENWNAFGDIAAATKKHFEETNPLQRELAQIIKLLEDITTELSKFSTQPKQQTNQLYWAEQMEKAAEQLKTYLSTIVKQANVDSEHGIRKLILSLENRLKGKPPQ